MDILYNNKVYRASDYVKFFYIFVICCRLIKCRNALMPLPYWVIAKMLNLTLWTLCNIFSNKKKWSTAHRPFKINFSMNLKNQCNHHLLNYVQFLNYQLLRLNL